MRFQDNLKLFRENLPGKVSAKDFAKLLKIPYSTYLGYENKGTEPKYEVLCQIATALGVTTDKLLGYSLDEFERCRKIAERLGFPVEIKNGIVSVSLKPKSVFNFIDLKKFYLERSDFIAAINRSCTYADEKMKDAHDSLQAGYLHGFMASKSTLGNQLRMADLFSAEKGNS